jgi:ketosteroid isomerase-like protein
MSAVAQIAPSTLPPSPCRRDTARAMSQENVEVVRKGIEAWNQHDGDLWLSYAAPDVEWMPAGPAAVESTVYRGHDEVAGGFNAIWQTWEVFHLEETEIRDLGDSVLWLGHVKIRGSASHIDLDQEFAFHTRLQDGQVIAVRSFLGWREALEAVGLSEQDAHADS